MGNESEHDFTKLMIEAIRAKSSNHINFLNENEGGGATGGMDMNSNDMGGATAAPISADNVESNLDGDEEEIDNVDANEEQEEDDGLSTPEAKEEITKINETVSPLVNVKTFKIYEDSGNVVMSGDLQISELKWQFSKDSGLFINASNVNLTEELKNIIDKLSNYYTNWQLEWAGKIGEYMKKD